MIDRVRSAPRLPVGLDDPVSASGDEDDSPTWASRLVDPSVPDPQASLEATERQRHLYAFMRLELRADEQAAICRRFGLPWLAPEEGVRQLAKLPRQRVRRLEIQALEKLKHSEHLPVLAAFQHDADGAVPESAPY